MEHPRGANPANERALLYLNRKPVRALSFKFALLACLVTVKAQAATDCAAIANAETGKPQVHQGLCNDRGTRASTFKIPFSLMAFNSGFL